MFQTKDANGTVVPIESTGDPFVSQDGKIKAPSGPGLGVLIDPEYVAKHKVFTGRWCIALQLKSGAPLWFFLAIVGILTLEKENRRTSLSSRVFWLVADDLMNKLDNGGVKESIFIRYENNKIPILGEIVHSWKKYWWWSGP